MNNEVEHRTQADGAWADASSWSGEVATLQAAGYDVRAIANPLQDLTTDSEYVAD
jgi:hypothetical protein